MGDAVTGAISADAEEKRMTRRKVEDRRCLPHRAISRSTCHEETRALRLGVYRWETKCNNRWYNHVQK